MWKIFALHNYRGSIAAALLLFVFSQPYFVWGDFLQDSYVQFLLGIAMAVLFLRNMDKNSRIRFLAIYFLAVIIFHAYVQGYNIYYAMSLMTIAALPIANKEFTRSTYINFLNIYCFITALSLIVWGLYLVGAAPQLGTIDPLNNLKEHVYIHYPFLVTPPGAYRFLGVFDEPGAVGTMSGIFLCIQGINLKDKRNIILLLSGIASMSMFFYLMIAAYGVLYYSVDNKSVWKTILVVAVLVGGFYAIQYVPILNELIGSRLEWDADNMRFVGDNRSSEALMDYLSSLVGTHEFWFGVENKKGFFESVLGECNIYITLLMNGVLFSLLYLGFMSMYGLHNKKTWGAFILFMFVFLTSVYQRPFLFNANYVFLWICMAQYEILKDNTGNLIDIKINRI